MTGPHDLTPDERERIYERRIRPDLLANAKPSTSPVAMVVAGQPGAGVSVAASTLRQGLTRATGPLVSLSEDRLRAYHPAWRQDAAGTQVLGSGSIQSDVAHWFDRLLAEAQNRHLHLLVEDEMRETHSLLKHIGALRKERYVVQAVFVSTHRDESTLAVMAQYDLLHQHRLPPRFISVQEHETAWSNMHTAAGLLEDWRAVDGIRVIDRTTAQFYENRLINGEWSRAPRTQASLDILRDKPRLPRDLVRLTMQWDTLVQRLAHDATVPRDVASQALTWRNEVAARCEATPATAQMLQWAREGAAFRVMDRFEFEREFPHHGRAARSLGTAVIEAEKYPASEGVRFLASARENIAQRIERGEMARIAAREKTHEPPTR